MKLGYEAQVNKIAKKTSLQLSEHLSWNKNFLNLLF